MPDVLWPLFQQNRHLLHALPVLIMVIFYTFGRHLNFNCHLHILVSEGVLHEDATQWHAGARLDVKALMPMWCSAGHHAAAGSCTARGPWTPTCLHPMRVSRN